MATVGTKVRTKHDAARADEARRRIFTYGTPEKNYADSGLWEYLSYVRTKDEHDMVHESKPLMQDASGGQLEYLTEVAWAMLAGEQVGFPKSRQMRLSWIVAAFATWFAQTAPHRLILWQNEAEDDAIGMVTKGFDDPMLGRCSFIIHHLPAFLRDPRATSRDGNKEGNLIFSNNSRIKAIPKGANQVRSKVPSLYISDECAFQPEFEEAYTAAQPCINGGGKALYITTAEPGFFAEIVRSRGEGDHLPVPLSVLRGGRPFPRGMEYWMSSYGVHIVQVHYSADPSKDPTTDVGREWVRRTAPRFGGVLSPKWRKEFEIDWEVAGGTPVFPFAVNPECKIWTPMPNVDDVLYRVERGESEIIAGYDHGSQNPSAFEVWEFRNNGTCEAIWEYYEPCIDFEAHCEAIKACPYWDAIKIIKCDPSITNRKAQYAAKGMETLGSLYGQRGVTLSAGRRGAAEPVTLERFLGHHWNDLEKPTAFVSAACPHLAHEIRLLRWQKHESAKTAQKKNNPEKIQDKDNHGWDASCYAHDSRPMPLLRRRRMETPPMTMKWLQERQAREENRERMASKYV